MVKMCRITIGINITYVRICYQTLASKTTGRLVWHAVEILSACRVLNPTVKTKRTNFRREICLDRPCESAGLSW